MVKPLMVIGVRQIGKTYTIKKFIHENFKECICFNLEKEETIRNIFDKTIDPKEIIENIELHINKKIDIENTILFFDEVQVSENFIVSLKYFNEADMPYKIICAGSLLGVKINRFNSSFPVGKIKLEHMYPMNFEEFLMALDKNILIQKIRECYENNEPMPEFAHEEALNLYRRYLCVGGMPEAVKNFIENGADILKFDSHLLPDIIKMYIADMQKYVKNNIETIKIEKLYNNIPKQLGKDKKNFQYNLIEENARKRKYETPLEWLISSGLVLASQKVKKSVIPLKIYVDEDNFKLYLSDVGILTAISQINYPDIILDTKFEYKGAICENYIAQEFSSKDISLYYWTYGRNAKIDFLLYNNDGIIPVEVKAGDNVKSTSLNTYITQNKPKYAIRISTKNFGFENGIKSIPLYAVFCIN